MDIRNDRIYELLSADTNNDEGVSLFKLKDPVTNEEIDVKVTSKNITVKKSNNESDFDPWGIQEAVIAMYQSDMHANWEYIEKNCLLNSMTLSSLMDKSKWGATEYSELENVYNAVLKIVNDDSITHLPSEVLTNIYYAIKIAYKNLKSRSACLNPEVNSHARIIRTRRYYLTVSVILYPIIADINIKDNFLIRNNDLSLSYKVMITRDIGCLSGKFACDVTKQGTINLFHDVNNILRAYSNDIKSCINSLYGKTMTR